MRTGSILVRSLILAMTAFVLLTGGVAAHEGEDHSGATHSGFDGANWFGVAGIIAVAGVVFWRNRRGEEPPAER